MKGKYGRFYGIGVGPGDPELITVKGAKILEISDVVYVPTKTTKEKSFAFSIVKRFVKNARIKSAVFPMSYNDDELKMYREKVVNEILDDLKSFATVSFITIGDPMLYSTYSYILKMLQNKAPNIYTETVPGISSVSMIASKSGEPLACEDEKLLIYPITHFDEDEFSKLYDNVDSMVLMKFPKDSRDIVEKIRKFKFKKVVYMKNICMEDEELRYDIDASELYESKRKYFTIVMLKK